jgi:DNA-binding ferritin-like protein
MGGEETVATTKHPQAKDTSTIAREISAENTPESPVVQNLRKQVANAIVLYLNYKEKHECWARDILRTGDGLCT